MEQKSFSVAEVKAAGGKGEFEALVSVFGNIDAVGDRVHRGAFSKAIAEQAPPPVVWSHKWDIPPVGETLDWSESDKGLTIKGRLFVEEDDRHQYADMVYAAMKSRGGRQPALRQFSFAYDVEEADTSLDEGVKIRELKSIFPVGEVGPCLRGVNSATELIAEPKSHEAFPSFGAKSLEELAQLLAPHLAAHVQSQSTEASPDAGNGRSEIPAWRFPPLHVINPASSR